MRKALVAAVGLMLVATVANAGAIDFFLSTQGIPDTNHAALPIPGNPSVTPAGLVPLQVSDGTGSNVYNTVGTGLYLWAQLTWTSTAAHWSGVALQAVTTGDLATPGFSFYNDTEYATARWDNKLADGVTVNPLIGPNAAGQTLAATTGSIQGLGMKTNYKPGGTVSGNDFYSIGVGTPNLGPYTVDYLVGFLPITGTQGTIKLATFTNGGTEAGGWITQFGATQGSEVVNFGTGDVAVNNRPVFGTLGTSEVADATITPEPASLVLLALAGLALRRR